MMHKSSVGKQNRVTMLIAFLLCGISLSSYAAKVVFTGSTLPSNSAAKAIAVKAGTTYKLVMQGKFTGIGRDTGSLVLGYTYGVASWAFDTLVTNGAGTNPIVKTGVGSNGELSAIFVWTPDLADTGKIYTVNFILKSRSATNSETRTYYIKVYGKGRGDKDSSCRKAIKYVTTGAGCNGDSNGSINLTVVGNRDTLTYNWTGPNGFSATTEDIRRLVAGVYTVTINERGCNPLVDSIKVPESTLKGYFNITMRSAKKDRCQQGYIFWGLDTSISVTVAGGKPPYTYNWTKGATGSGSTGIINTSGTPPTDFTVEVTDATGCKLVLSVKPCIVDVKRLLCDRDSNKIYVCHRTGQKSDSGKTITLCVDVDAVWAHLLHGDELGKCDPNADRRKSTKWASEPNDVKKMRIYPNPGKGNFKISLDENAGAIVTVTDMQGKTVFSKSTKPGDTEISVELANAEKGIYFLNVQNGANSYKEKVFVE